MKLSSFILLVASVTSSFAFIPKAGIKNSAGRGLQSSVAPTPPTSTAKRQKQSASVKKSIPKRASTHKRWGVDAKFEKEYWCDARIHSLGNVGFMGAVHAACAALVSKMIDMLAYKGVDMRLEVATKLFKAVGKDDTRVVDLCCGVGTSTRALKEAFPKGVSVVGVDTSSQMIAMAEFLTGHLAFFKPSVWGLGKLSLGYLLLNEQRNKIIKATNGTIRYARSNAEDTKLPTKSFDLVTIMYAFHEAPEGGRERIIKEARRLLDDGGTLAVVDISTEYKPSDTMLLGEPYVLEYQKNIHRQLSNFKGFGRSEYTDLVPGHVGMWLLKRKPNA